MQTGIDAKEVCFRRSEWRVLVFLGAVVMVFLAAISLLGVLVYDNAWYDPFPQAPIFLLAAAGYYAQLRRETGLPILLTRDHLVLTRPDGESVAIDWDNLAFAEVRGAIVPRLAVEVMDPNRTRPVLTRWDWAEIGQRSLSPARRPHEVHVSLLGVTPSGERLRAELADRVKPAVPAASPTAHEETGARERDA